MKLACRIKKPLFLHERDAHDDMVAILRKYEGNLPRGVVHCFTGDVEHAKVYLKMGFYIGITGNIFSLLPVFPNPVSQGFSFFSLLPVSSLLTPFLHCSKFLKGSFFNAISLSPFLRYFSLTQPVLP